MNQLRLLEYAVALDHHRSFARAAQAMLVTQPSFSRAIATLESRLDVRLFERNNREVRPTAAGQILLQRARRLLADHAAIGDALDAQRTLRSGSLSVAAGPYALEISVTEAVARLARRHPRLQIELIEGDWRRLGPSMLAGNIDLGVFDLRTVENDYRFVVEAMPAHPGHFFTRQGHPLAGRRGLGIQQVLAYPLVGVRGPYQILAGAAGSAAGLQIDAATGDIVPQLSTTSSAATRAVVQRTDGVGIAALAQLEEDIRLGRLVTLDVAWPGIKSYYGIVTLRERPLSAAALALADCIREVEAERVALEAVPRPAPPSTVPPEGGPPSGIGVNGPARAGRSRAVVRP